MTSALVMMAIYLRNIYFFFNKSACNDLFDDHIDDRKYRNSQKHPDDPEETTPNDNGKHDPQTWQTHRITQNEWPDDVAIKLLQH